MSQPDRRRMRDNEGNKSGGGVDDGAGFRAITTQAAAATAAGEVPAESTTRKPSRNQGAPLRHPVDVKLHHNDFSFDEYKRFCQEREKQQQQQPQPQDGDEHTDGAAPAAASSAGQQQQQQQQQQPGKKANVELDADAAAKYLAAQGASWERHYAQTRNNFFPIKNYLTQAFRTTILPLFPRDQQRSEEDRMRAEAAEGGGDGEEALVSDPQPPPSNKVDEGEVTPAKAPKPQQQQLLDTPASVTPAIREKTMSKPRDDDEAQQQQQQQQQQRQAAAVAAATESKQAAVHDSDDDAPPPPRRYILECGCGTGSALLPLMNCIGAYHTFAGFDISATAVELFRQHDIVQRKMIAEHGNPPTLFVHDVAVADIPAHLVAPQSADIVLLVFVLCAIERAKMPDVLRRLHAVMKPGGKLLFRDHGELDNSFFRFKKNGNAMCRGSFVKGDETLQYFFSIDETKQLFGECGFVADEIQYHCNQVTNRKTGVSMHKIILNATFTRR